MLVPSMTSWLIRLGPSNHLSTASKGQSGVLQSTYPFNLYVPILRHQGFPPTPNVALRLLQGMQLAYSRPCWQSKKNKYEFSLSAPCLITRLTTMIDKEKFRSFLICSHIFMWNLFLSFLDFSICKWHITIDWFHKQ